MLAANNEKVDQRINAYNSDRKFRVSLDFCLIKIDLYRYRRRKKIFSEKFQEFSGIRQCSIVYNGEHEFSLFAAIHMLIFTFIHLYRLN